MIWNLFLAQKIGKVKTLIRGLLWEPSDLGLHLLPLPCLQGWWVERIKRLSNFQQISHFSFSIKNNSLFLHVSLLWKIFLFCVNQLLVVLETEYLLHRDNLQNSFTTGLQIRCIPDDKTSPNLNQYQYLTACYNRLTMTILTSGQTV